jgi:(S)-beta-macrocarpene synthase
MHGVSLYLNLILELKVHISNLWQLFCSSLHRRWWKELRVESNLSFVRDRIVEVYFWMSAGCYDPQYSHSRIILTKIVAFIMILDDTLDTHATTYESMQLAEAVERYSPHERLCLVNYIFFLSIKGNSL